MMNLVPTELERLVVFQAAEFARRNRRDGVRLSHPEAVALLSDEVMHAARRDLPYHDIVALAHGLLTADDVEPGVPEMVDVLYVEGNFAEGTKVVCLFRPIGPGTAAAADAVPGDVLPAEGTIELNAGRERQSLRVVNTGDRDIQVRSHAHFFEVNRALVFDRAASYGMRLDVPSGTGLRFEPGLEKEVTLVPFAGHRHLTGFAGLVDGPLDAPETRTRALAAARARGYLTG